MEGNFLEMHVLPLAFNEYGIKRLPLEALQQIKFTDYITRFIFDRSEGTEQFFFNESGRPREAKDFKDFQLTTRKDGKQVVVIETKVALLDVWITGRKEHVHADRNFLVLLPGKHEIVIESGKKLVKDDIILKFR